MRNLTSRFVALATASALIAGCSTQQASTSQASAGVCGSSGRSRVGSDERNPKACWKYDWPLSHNSYVRETALLPSPPLWHHEQDDTDIAAACTTADYILSATLRTGLS